MNTTTQTARRAYRFRQAKRDTDERRAICGAIKERLSWSNDGDRATITLRTDERTIFRAERIRRSTHFPYIVPELVDEHGDYLLITYLSFGSLLRLNNILS